MTIKTGRWEWTKEDPFPPWPTVCNCKLWDTNDDTYRGLRSALAQALVDPTVEVKGDVASVRIHDQDEASDRCLVFPLEDTVPKTITTLNFRMVILELDDESTLEIHPLLKKVLRKGSPILVLGPPLVVEDMQARLLRLVEGWESFMIPIYNKHFEKRAHVTIGHHIMMLLVPRNQKIGKVAPSPLSPTLSTTSLCHLLQTSSLAILHYPPHFHTYFFF